MQPVKDGDRVQVVINMKTCIEDEACGKMCPFIEITHVNHSLKYICALTNRQRNEVNGEFTIPYWCPFSTETDNDNFKYIIIYTIDRYCRDRNNYPTFYSGETEIISTYTLQEAIKYLTDITDVRYIEKLLNISNRSDGEYNVVNVHGVYKVLSDSNNIEIDLTTTAAFMELTNKYLAEHKLNNKSTNRKIVTKDREYRLYLKLKEKYDNDGVL